MPSPGWQSGSSISGPSSKSHRCGQWKPPSWVVQGNLRGSWAGGGGLRPACTAHGRGQGVWFEEPTEDPGCAQWTGHGCEVQEGRHESSSWARMETHRKAPGSRWNAAEVVPPSRADGEAGGQSFGGFGQGKWRALCIGLGLWKWDSLGARWRQALHYLWVQGEQVVTHGLPEAVLGNLVVRLQLEVCAQWGAAYRGSGTYNS